MTVCTWCGHRPHPGRCPRNITTGPKTTTPCPCKKQDQP